MVRGLWLGLAVVFFLGAIPIALKAFHLDFVPSEAWVTRTSGFASTFCFGAAVLATILFAVDMVQRGERIGTPGTIGMILFIPVFFWFLGSALVMLGYPMIRAAWAGQPMTMVFEVERAKVGASARCRNRIELRGLPVLINEVCGLPAESIVPLAPGSSVTLGGYGTELGLFVQRIEGQAP
jgi:hypothetical protein